MRSLRASISAWVTGGFVIVFLGPYFLPFVPVLFAHLPLVSELEEANEELFSREALNVGNLRICHMSIMR